MSDETDPMGPPEVPCECECLHCGRIFMSDRMWFQKVIGARDGFPGFWMCPTPNCGGAGFTFDIFPTDPSHPANEGWHYFDDDEEEDPEGPDTPEEWDPEEKKFKELDEEYLDAGEDPDGDGEDRFWERPELTEEQKASLEAQEKEWERHREEEERSFDGPDLRPRELDWSNREEPGGFADEDIPF